MNVYDFDNTIYAGDSSIDFYLFCIKRHPSLMLFLPRQIVAAIKYKRGRITKDCFKQIYFSFLSKLKNPQKEVKMFWDVNQKKIKNWYLKQQKQDDLIISASPRFLLDEICKRNKIRRLIATEVDINSGLFLSLNCYGYEKVKRFKELYPEEKIEEFYSDSLSDYYLAEIANISFIVKGNDMFFWSNNEQYRRTLL